MFKFELESVLSLKQNMEDKKKRELGLANREKELLVAEKTILVKHYEETCHALKKQNGVVLDVQNVKVSHLYAGYLLKQVERKERQIEEAQQKIDIKRQELYEAMKERKILENLKEIKREQYDEELKKAEQLIVDGLVSYKYRVGERSEE